MKDLFGEFLESIFNNIFKLYKTYFVHWTISRILITLFSLVAIVVLIILPASIFVYKYIGYDQILKFISSFGSLLDKAQIGQEPDLKNLFMPKLLMKLEPIVMIMWGLMGFISIILTGLILGYANAVLVTRMNLGYIRDLPVDHGKNKYFSYGLFLRFGAIQLIRFGATFLATIALVILFGLISLISKLIGGSVLVGIVGVVGFIGIIIGAIYISVRLIFTEYVLADADKDEFPVFDAFKQSWRMTRKKALWIILISAVAGLTIWIGVMILESILGLIPYFGTIISFLATSYVGSMMMSTIYEEVRILHSRESTSISH